MSTTIAGAIITALAGKNIVALGGATPRIGRDIAGDNAAFPFVTFLDPVSSVIALQGSRKTIARTRRMQWDLWQKRADENDSLLRDLVQGLDLLAVTGPFTDIATSDTVFRVRVQTFRRMYDPKPEIVHHAIDVLVTHGGG